MLLVSIVWLMAVSPAAGQSSIQNARLQERPAGELGQTFQQLSGEREPLWVAYAVPAESGWNACCRDDWAGSQRCCGSCALEDRGAQSANAAAVTRTEPIKLEGSSGAVVLYRFEEGRVGKIRVFGESCMLDAGGRTVYWLTGVDPAASVLWLKGLVHAAGNDGPGTSAARHLVSEGLLAITAHRAPEAVTALIDLARNAPQARVRSDALFWLAQRAGRKAAGTITDAIENDPETKVKERAVFALSQMPADEGVPRLIEVARTNRNPRVRRQAVFWLGQSKDPRALAFFEEILK